jgi:Flp pilus assembly protein TadD/peroxiredoxin
MWLPENDHQRWTRRKFLKDLGLAPLILRPSPLYGSFLFPETPQSRAESGEAFGLAGTRYVPHYPARSPLEAVLRLVPPGSDDYIEERYAAEIGAALERWADAFKTGGIPGLAGMLDPALEYTPLNPVHITKLRSGGVETFRREYPGALQQGAPGFLRELQEWIGRDAQVDSAGFEIISLDVISAVPLRVRAAIRYSIVANRGSGQREQRTGYWLTDWSRDVSSAQPQSWKLQRWQAETEMLSVASGPVFVDVTWQAMGHTDSYQAQMLHGSDHWRTVLDGACGIDVYGNNGIAAGDFDNDGFDDLYVSQPAGLPNRLYRNRGDGTFDDVTEAAGVGVLDNTSCALFADLRNSGLQDLLVVCGNGPLLFLNQGDGTFKLKRDAFQFAHTPQGTFTHAAIADYDRDGRLDIYFCLYSYYLGLDQYHYPVPYFDARNGPPNFLLHNEGNGTFTDRTEAAGLNVENDRYSFACAWGESASSNAPDLYVVNDFGRNNLYRNNGDGTFTAASTKSHVEDVGAGMSAAWADFNNDGLADIYVANMWSAAGQRVSQQGNFHEKATEPIRELYRRHAQGNALYQNQADKTFRNVGQRAGADMGRWAWCSDFWDFDHDGYADLYVTNGYISAAQTEQRTDLGSFFWRQVVAKSPEDATPSLAYEHGWNAINELIRSDSSWSGFERNVMFANNRDGTFSDVSGAVGMDFLEDGRSFALADIDHDGRLEVIVKNRNAPQLRVLHNAMQEIGDSIAFRLRGTKSNRDAIGAAITVEAGDLRQTKYLQAGSGFLAQHSKELFFGVGKSTASIAATVRWPSGLTQRFEGLPRNSRILLEEGSATFEAKPFVAASVATAPASVPEKTIAKKLSTAAVETWLIDPLKAPAFSLPDLAGTMQQFQSLRGEVTLLLFWATISPTSIDQLRLLQQHRSALEAAHLRILAVNVDDAADQSKAGLAVEQLKPSFAVLFATDEVAGIYNIIYRYLFDRRRDLAIPTSFLLDGDGMIVKVYQGAFTSERLTEDARSIPTTPAERMKKALPFAGTLYQSEFLRNDYTYGVAMFQHGYLEQAEESFKQVVAAKPDDAEGYYNLGTLKLRKNDFAQARSYLARTLKLKPDYPEAWNNLGMMAAQEGHSDEAIDSFTKSLQLRPTYATALLNLGNVYRRKGDSAKAQECLTRALDLQPDDPETNYSLGMMYAQQGQLQLAEEYLRKAVDLRADYAEALNNLGVIFVRRQDYASAEQQFKTCIRIVPSFDQAYLNLARLYVVQHDKAKATATLEELLRMRPESAAGKQGLQMLESMP